MAPLRSRVPKHPKSCHERALGLLAVRPRSRRELQVRLRQAGFEDREVEEVLERLERAGLIDDEVFARQLIEHQLGSRKAGRRSVERALAAKGVAPETTRAILAQVPDQEEDRALALATSRAGRLGGLDPTRAFARLSSLLVRRGYDADVARRAARRALTIDEIED